MLSLIIDADVVLRFVCFRVTQLSRGGDRCFLHPDDSAVVHQRARFRARLDISLWKVSLHDVREFSEPVASQSSVSVETNTPVVKQKTNQHDSNILHWTLKSLNKSQWLRTLHLTMLHLLFSLQEGLQDRCNSVGSSGLSALSHPRQTPLLLFLLQL